MLEQHTKSVHKGGVIHISLGFYTDDRSKCSYAKPDKQRVKWVTVGDFAA